MGRKTITLTVLITLALWLGPFGLFVLPVWVGWNCEF